jgi:hypothetical protein
MVEEESLKARQISNVFQLVDSSSLDESLVGHWSQNTFLITCFLTKQSLLKWVPYHQVQTETGCGYNNVASSVPDP